MTINTIFWEFEGVLTGGVSQTEDAIRIIAESESGKTHSKEKVREIFDSLMPYAYIGEKSFRDICELTVKELGISVDLNTVMDAYLAACCISPNMEELMNALQEEGIAQYLISDSTAEATGVIKAQYAARFQEMLFSDEKRVMKHDGQLLNWIIIGIPNEKNQCICIDSNHKALAHPDRLGIHTILFQDEEQCKLDLEKIMKT